MDDTAQETGENDAFARLLAQLNAPTTEQVVAPTTGAHAAPPSPGSPEARVPVAASFVAPTASTRAPELMGADELAAPPRPFPPLPVAATPLVAPPRPPALHPGGGFAPAPVPAPDALAPVAENPVAAHPVAVTHAPVASVTAAPVTAAPVAPAPVRLAPRAVAPSPPDFAALLIGAPSPVSSPPLPTGSLFGSDTTVADEPDIAKSTVGEKIVLILAILLPPLGLLAAIVAAIRSAQRRGWVIGLLRAALAIAVVLSVVVGIAGYIGYTQLQQQRAHDRVATASAGFCSTIAADPSMIRSPDLGWPAKAATITDSLAAMQAYEDKWTKLAKVSPATIRPEVTKIATAAKQIIDAVTVGRTVNDASNISVMTATASVSGVPGWYREYCK